MHAASATPLQGALDAVDALSADEQRELVDIVWRRLVEKRRDEIARNTAEARAAFAAGQLPSGAVEDLLADILGEAEAVQLVIFGRNSGGWR